MKMTGNDVNAPRWLNADGQLMIGRSPAGGRVFFPPHPVVPGSLEDSELVPACGRGTVYSFSVVRRGAPTPYVLAFVTLAEGPTLLTNIVDCDFETLAIGQPVVLRVVTGATGPMPAFTPA